MDSQSIDPSNPFFMFEVSKVCAVCTKNLLKGRVYSLKTTIFSQTSIRMYQFLESMFQFKYQQNGPSNLCSECYSKVLNTFHFQKQCKEAQKLFDKYLEYQEEFTSLDEIDLSISDKTLEEEIQIKDEPESPEVKAIRRKDMELVEDEAHIKHPDEVESITDDDVTQNATKLTCKYCGLEFRSNNSSYREHINIHKMLYVCSVCGKILGSKFRLLVHERSHEARDSYKCDLCPQTFLRKMDKNSHALTHLAKNERKEYVCKYCGDVFETVTPFEHHMNIHRKKYVCSICDKSFGCRKHLVDHQKLHTGELKYSCGHCSLAFKTQRGLHQHSEKHRRKDKVYKCDMCPKRYTNRKSLGMHKAEAHRLVNQHECPGCDMKFAYLCKLKKHLQSHLNEIQTKQPIGVDGDSGDETGHVIIEINNDYLLSNITQLSFSGTKQEA